MMVQAEVSLYPLGQGGLQEPIAAFVDELNRRGIEGSIGPMSTRLSGEVTEVFEAMGAAFAQVADQRGVVLVVKVSNACPAT